ncbi:DUF6131 family protein [Lysinibacillus sp. NPDC097287]|uniref:DUF6131 family protein n=2 Tax=Bacillati TaxID=1783272 RepID=UPI003800B845
MDDQTGKQGTLCHHPKAVEESVASGTAVPAPSPFQVFEDCDQRVRRPRWVIRVEGGSMIILGIVLLIVGFLTGISILWTIGIILVVIGVVLFALGAAGHAVGGRRHYY